MNGYNNVEKITVYQIRKNISLSTLNQRRDLKLKQCWFWFDNVDLLFFCFDTQEVIIFMLMLKRFGF